MTIRRALATLALALAAVGIAAAGAALVHHPAPTATQADSIVSRESGW